MQHAAVVRKLEIELVAHDTLGAQFLLVLGLQRRKEGGVFDLIDTAAVVRTHETAA
jgi:hypothetical protein